ncbi:hypothetical protein CWS20_06690 [Cytobacillus horneckiae]|uniref:Uncharacterized protein n=1 Tax=Cytobacillus horneckiae TaxID=549687 RepID=A0A2N0ZJ72_9BACI|nr:hypothetical protein CWS20_06690 [Cytobacillus horneckiae]
MKCSRKSERSYGGRPKRYHKKHACMRHAIELYKMEKYTEISIKFLFAYGPIFSVKWYDYKVIFN